MVNLIQPVVQAAGLELWGVELISHNNRSTLRIYIDHDDGVTIDHCERVSRQVSSLFDVEDPIAGNYTLEVSSPGMDRPLYELKHYEKMAGEMAKIRLTRAFEGRRNFRGRLNGVEGDEVRLVVEDEEYFLPFELVEKAKILPTF